MMVWAFNGAEGAETRLEVYQSVKSGKSRFGWSQSDDRNLKIENNWTDDHSAQLFLLQVKKGDWIVHINTPEQGKCTAAQVLSEYDFDEGLLRSWGRDFRHFFAVDTESVMEFDRKDPNVLPTVNLYPRRRYHRVYAIDDFLRSIENIKDRRIQLSGEESREEYHLRDKLNEYLPGISNLIHETHKGKSLEGLFAKVFSRIPGVTEVIENGSRWGTDHGADLIVTTSSYLGTLEISNTVIVQIKSYEGVIHDLTAVEQIKTGVKKYAASAGFIITTAEKSDDLEQAIQSLSNEINIPIVLLASDDMVRFVIKHAPELLFELEAVS